MPKKDRNRTSEQRYYVTAAEAQVIADAADLESKSKSDYCRDTILPRAVRALIAAGRDVPVELRHKAAHLDRDDAAARRLAPSLPIDPEERRLIEAFEAIREVVMRRKS